MPEPVDKTLLRTPVIEDDRDEKAYIYEAFDISQKAALIKFGCNNGITEETTGRGTYDLMKAIYQCLDKKTGGIPLTMCMTFEVDEDGLPLHKGIGVVRQPQIMALAMGHWNKPPTEEEKQKIIEVVGLDSDVRTVKVKIPFLEGPEKQRNFHVFGDSIYTNARVLEERKSPAVQAWLKEHNVKLNEEK